MKQDCYNDNIYILRPDYTPIVMLTSQKNKFFSFFSAM